MEILHALLNGTSPLLMHNPQGMTASPGDALSIKSVPSPEEEAAASRYLLPDGNFYVKAVAVRKCLINGAKGYRIGRVGAPGVLSGAIGLLKGEFPLLDSDGKPYSGDKYSIDTQRVVLNPSRGRAVGILRSRARVELPWMLEAVFEFDSALCNLENVKMALERGGKAVGLLDGRPQSGLWYGKFEVKDIWTEIQ